MRRAGAVLTATLLMVGLLGAPSEAGPQSRCARARSEYVYLNSFKVETEVPEGPFHPGDTVPFPTLVTRPAEEDPLGLGIPLPRPHVEPAPEVRVTLVGMARDVLLIDYDVTNDEGKVALGLKLPKYTPEGPVTVRFYAEKELANANCVVVYETGKLIISPAFEVERRG